MESLFYLDEAECKQRLAVQFDNVVFLSILSRFVKSTMKGVEIIALRRKDGRDAFLVMMMTMMMVMMMMMMMMTVVKKISSSSSIAYALYKLLLLLSLCV